MLEGSSNLRPIIIGIGALAVVVILGLIFVFPPKATRLAQPLIDPALSARLRADAAAADRAYAQFQQKYPPSKVQKLQQDLNALSLQLQQQQNAAPR